MQGQMGFIYNHITRHYDNRKCVDSMLEDIRSNQLMHFIHQLLILMEFMLIVTLTYRSPCEHVW